MRLFVCALALGVKGVEGHQCCRGINTLSTGHFPIPAPGSMLRRLPPFYLQEPRSLKTPRVCLHCFMLLEVLLQHIKNIYFRTQEKHLQECLVKKPACGGVGCRMKQNDDL